MTLETQRSSKSVLEFDARSVLFIICERLTECDRLQQYQLC